MKKKARNNKAQVQKRAASPIRPSPNRETLTYAQAQRMVELEVDGRMHRISIYDKLGVLADDDPTAQELLECNSNKENSERPPQAPVRSARLKNSQQRKSAALADQQGAREQGSKLPEPKIRIVEYNLPAVPRRPASYYTYAEKTPEELDEEVEYDMDEEDYAWLELVNEKRRGEGFSQVSPNVFEFLMDRLEKEAFLEGQGRGGSDPRPPVDEDAVCCVCGDGECHDSNAILFCDLCNLAVHQECYGVPHIPEGQWLCRSCLQAPGRPAECVLCPNRGGALKRTDDNRWGHVACALWVPEVGFADAVLVEPIDGVRSIPPARWKLTCYLCKEKGVGACIQCHRANCYTAFHVSCAQKAGLYMKMEAAGAGGDGDAGAFSVKKTAYCGAHTPAGCVRRPLAIYEDTGDKGRGRARPKGNHSKKKKGKKTAAEPVPVVQTATVPSIPMQRLHIILSQVSVQKKKVFFERVLSYWTLKRQSRNGAPLLRRLQTTLQAQKTTQPKENEEESRALKEQLRDWHRLRHDLERARLLLELIRKREKLKREEVKLQQTVLEMQLTPLTVLLRSVLDQLQEKDQARIFAQPVSIKEVPDYLDHIKHPMDFSTMRKRIEAQGYRNLDEFEDDFNLIVANCMKYNAKDTIFYRGRAAAGPGRALLRKARRHAEAVGFDRESGLHLPEAPKQEPPPPFSWEDVDRLLNPANRAHLSLEEQLKQLLEKLDLTFAMKSCPSRSKRLKLLKKEISEVRCEMSPKKTPPAPAEPSQPAAEEAGPAAQSVEEDGDKSLPPKLEPSDSLLPPVNSDTNSEPPTLKPIDPSPDKCHKPAVTPDSDKNATSAPEEPPDGPAPESRPLPNGDVAEDAAPRARRAPGPVSRRTAVLFRKSKSVSPQKPAGGSAGDSSPSPRPQLGTKTFLSVVIPRLETLLQPRKRSRSASGDSETDEPSPRKRFDAGLSNGFIIEQEKGLSPSRPLEPRRRCASESSISSSGSLPCSSSSFSLPKCGKGKPAPARRSTADDKAQLVACIESGNFAKAARLAADNRPQDAQGGLPSQWGVDSDTSLDVLRIGEQMQYKSGEKLFLVLFFDNKRSWQWLPKSKMVPLGMDKTIDKIKLMEGRTSGIRKAVQTAFGRAVHHLSRVRDEPVSDMSDLD